jgi:hypothetical protein
MPETFAIKKSGFTCLVPFGTLRYPIFIQEIGEIPMVFLLPPILPPGPNGGLNGGSGADPRYYSESKHGLDPAFPRKRTWLGKPRKNPKNGAVHGKIIGKL